MTDLYEIVIGVRVADGGEGWDAQAEARLKARLVAEAKALGLVVEEDGGDLVIRGTEHDLLAFSVQLAGAPASMGDA